MGICWRWGVIVEVGDDILDFEIGRMGMEMVK